jgi:hypothetical protein
MLIATTLTGFAQQRHIFKFEAERDMLFLKGNEAELERLHDFVEQNKPQITSGQMPVQVDGYCASFENRHENLKTAALRSNRVKSEMIVKNGLKEEHFITANHAESYEGMKDAVVVTFTVREEKQETKPEEQPKPEQQPQPPVKEQPKQPEEPQPVKEAQPAPQAVTDIVPDVDLGKISLRTNLLYWAVATPNLGLEWKLSNNIGILINGAYSHWIWSDKGKHHRTWLVQPELRYYMGENKNWFIGLEGHAGEFNFKFGDTGYQGDTLGGGLTGGYRLRLGKAFDMDFSLGLGYTDLKYESYTRSNDVMVRKEGGLSKNGFAPTQAGVSLIWKIK